MKRDKRQRRSKRWLVSKVVKRHFIIAITVTAICSNIYVQICMCGCNFATRCTMHKQFPMQFVVRHAASIQKDNLCVGIVYGVMVRTQYEVGEHFLTSFYKQNSRVVRVNNWKISLRFVSIIHCILVACRYKCCAKCAVCLFTETFIVYCLYSSWSCTANWWDIFYPLF